MDLADRFKNRTEAGQWLASQLDDLRGDEPVVLALPRGGVVVGAVVAEALDAPLDVVVARNFGAPGEDGLAVGAVAPDVLVVDDEAVRHFGLTDDQVEDLATRERTEMNRELRRYRDTDEVPDVEGRTVVVVDEGFTTGLRLRAALRAVRRRKPAHVVLAVSACAAATADTLRDEADRFVCGRAPESLDAIVADYHRFGQVTEEQVQDLLDAARRRMA